MPKTIRSKEKVAPHQVASVTSQPLAVHRCVWCAAVKSGEVRFVEETEPEVVSGRNNTLDGTEAMLLLVIRRYSDCKLGFLGWVRGEDGYCLASQRKEPCGQSMPNRGATRIPGKRCP